jgi:hypothetical protein
MKMGAIIRLVCFIKTKNHVNTVQNFTFQSVNYEYNALFSFVFSQLYKQKICVFCHGHIVIFLFPCCTSSYITRICLAISYIRLQWYNKINKKWRLYVCYGSMWRGYFAGLRVTKCNKATVLLTLTLFQTTTRAVHSGGGGQGQLPPEKTIFTIFRMSY